MPSRGRGPSRRAPDPVSAVDNGQGRTPRSGRRTLITCCFLPAYAPDLSPAEGNWSLPRRSTQANTAFADPDHLMRALRRGLRAGVAGGGLVVLEHVPARGIGAVQHQRRRADSADVVSDEARLHGDRTHASGDG